MKGVEPRPLVSHTGVVPTAPLARTGKPHITVVLVAGCCALHSQATWMRVFIAVISVLGLGCVVVGIVLGALTVTGTARLTLCLLMIG